MIAKVNSHNITQLKSDILELINLSKDNDKASIVKKMKEIVPEFLSMNSDYQKFDNPTDKAS